MTSYNLNEGMLELPADFRDASMNLLSLSRPGGQLRVFLTRLPANGLALAAHASRRITDLRRKLPSFMLIAEGTGTLDGEPAAFAKISFDDGGVPTYQRWVSAVLEGRFVTIGVGGPKDAERDVDRLFDHIVRTAHVRAGRRAA